MIEAVVLFKAAAQSLEIPLVLHLSETAIAALKSEVERTGLCTHTIDRPQRRADPPMVVAGVEIREVRR